MFKIINAAITPGTQPQIVKINTITNDPHPLPKTAKGGKKMANKTLQILMVYGFFKIRRSLIQHDLLQDEIDKIIQIRFLPHQVVMRSLQSYLLHPLQL